MARKSPLGDADGWLAAAHVFLFFCRHVLPPWRALDHLLSSAKYSVAARKAQALARRARDSIWTRARARGGGRHVFSAVSREFEEDSKKTLRPDLDAVRRADAPAALAPKQEELTMSIEQMMIDNINADGAALNAEAGSIRFHVHHKWLVSKGAPHWPWNLLVITQEENNRIGNQVCPL